MRVRGCACSPAHGVHLDVLRSVRAHDDGAEVAVLRQGARHDGAGAAVRDVQVPRDPVEGEALGRVQTCGRGERCACVRACVRA